MTAQRKVDVVAGVVQTADGTPAKLTVDDDGALLTAGGGGGGGGTVTQGAGGNAALPWWVRLVNGAGDALAVALDATVAAIRDKFVDAHELPGEEFATTTAVGAYVIARDEYLGTPQFVYCDSSQFLRTRAAFPSFVATSRTPNDVYEEQRGIGYGCSLGFVRVFVDPTTALLPSRDICGYVLLLNQGGVALNGDFPLGAAIFPVKPGEALPISTNVFSEGFTNGLRVVFSTTPNFVTLGGDHLRLSVLSLA